MKTQPTRRKFLNIAGLTLAAGTVFSGNSHSDEQEEIRTPKIKIGQLGTAHAHAYKTGILHKLTDCFEFVGVAEDEMKLRLAAEKQKNYQKVTWMSSDEMLARSDIHAIAVEVSEHHCLPAALRCVRAGKHIHLDKPAGESLADFRQLLDEAKAKNLVVQMGYMYRYNPAVQFCIKAVKDGLLGNIFDVDAAMSRYDGEAARKRVADFVGGIPFLLGCHLVDLAVILLGEPKKIHPFLMKTRSDNCIDNSLTVFEYPQGCFATLRTTINEVEGFQQRHLTVRGNKGTIIVQPLEIKGNMSGGAVKLALTKDTEGFKKGYQTIEMPPLKDRYEDQWREFAEVINGKIVNPYTYEHDFMVQKCLLESCHIPF